MTDFGAGASVIGYLYQARYALFLLISETEDVELKLETLDDIVLHDEGSPKELLQAKHHAKPGSITDASPDLWKTLRVWSEHLRLVYVEHPELFKNKEVFESPPKQFRVKGGRILSHVCSSEMFPQKGTKLPLGINEIILGPESEMIIELGIREFLDERGLEYVPIYRSNVPYRA